MIAVGIDIGGTKCAAVIAEVTAGGGITFLSRREIKTEGAYAAVLDKLAENIAAQLQEGGLRTADVKSIGIACGGPLDGKTGVIQSPPNLIGWDNVPVSAYFQQRFGVVAKLRNDADAGAVAEWKYGAGRGCDNVVFLTFGTGLGAGLILNGKLYSGTNGNAGEVGHIRLSEQGPIGYGKRGSFEGFCSGGGIRQQINAYFTAQIQNGIKPKYYTGENSVSAKDLCAQAQAGDPDALTIFQEVGRSFGKGLSILIDILNPEVVIAGGVYMRAHAYIAPAMHETLKAECLPQSLSQVKILPSALGERIGDYAAVAAGIL
jgi:glucokinase